MSGFQKKYTVLLGQVTDKLRGYITGAPAALQSSIEYSLFGEGKRLRPVLFLAVMDAYSVSPTESAYKLAAATECVHTYSLVHDDLPAMDNDDLRRGKPTNHVKFGEATALLAGDALLNFAAELLLSAVKDDPGYAEAALLIMKYAGVNGMIGGQAIEFESDMNSAGQRLLLEVYEKKTCALISAAAVSAATVAGGSKSDLALWKEFGSQFGLCFQLKDDLLDDDGALLRLWGREKTERELAIRTDKALDCLAHISANTEFITDLVRNILARNTDGM